MYSPSLWKLMCFRFLSTALSPRVRLAPVIIVRREVSLAEKIQMEEIPGVIVINAAARSEVVMTNAINKADSHST